MKTKKPMNYGSVPDQSFPKGPRMIDKLMKAHEKSAACDPKKGGKKK